MTFTMVVKHKTMSKLTAFSDIEGLLVQVLPLVECPCARYFISYLVLVLLRKTQNHHDMTEKLFCFCLFDLILYVPVNNFSVTSGRICLG